MQFAEAQAQLVAKYANGGPGAVISGLVWLIAGTVWLRSGIVPAFGALFVGGIAIFPLSMLVCRFGLRTPQGSGANPLERLAMEGTLFLFAGLLVAWVLLHHVPALSFPVMAVTIGARYFTFRTLYGDAAYWMLGGVLALLGAIAMLRADLLPVNLALWVGAVEILFGIMLTMRRA